MSQAVHCPRELNRCPIIVYKIAAGDHCIDIFGFFGAVPGGPEPQKPIPKAPQLRLDQGVASASELGAFRNPSDHHLRDGQGAISAFAFGVRATF